jgi:hypothetical protein
LLFCQEVASAAADTVVRTTAAAAQVSSFLVDSAQIPDHDGAEQGENGEVEADDADGSEIAETFERDQRCLSSEIEGH